MKLVWRYLIQIRDKIKEINSDFTEYGRLYEEINAEINKSSPQYTSLKKLFEQKEHIIKQRSKKLEQLQVLINKINED